MIKKILNDIEYWEKLENYEKNIISVFAVKNNLTKYLKNIKNKKNKEIIDFGCGFGYAIHFIKDFKIIYAVDFSENMLNKAKEINRDYKNVNFIKGNLKTTFIKKVDVILAVSSVMPKNYNEFDVIIKNFLKNLKENGEIILVLPSFESATFFYHLRADYLFKQNKKASEIQEFIKKAQINENYMPLGYLITKINLIQKHWLREEILFRLSKYNFKDVKIEKLELDWEKQIVNYKHFKNYPKLWFWLVKIKN